MKSALLTISKSALFYMSQLCDSFGRHNEIGGACFGNYDQHGQPVVMLALPPGSKAEFSECSFMDDPDYINDAIVYTKDRYGLILLCFWHVHPGSFSEPSSIDLAQSSRFARKFGLQNLGYIILTAQDQYNEPQQRFWERYLTRFSGHKSHPIITVNSYVFRSDRSCYEPCSVKVIDYDGIQKDITDSPFIPDRYKLPMYYPDDKLKITGALETASSIPENFTEAFGNIVELVPPEFFIDGDLLTAERIFDGDSKLTLRYEVSNDDYMLIKASVDIGRIHKDITGKLRNFTRFDHAYLQACNLVTTTLNGGK